MKKVKFIYPALLLTSINLALGSDFLLLEVQSEIDLSSDTPGGILISNGRSDINDWSVENKMINNKTSKESHGYCFITGIDKLKLSQGEQFFIDNVLNDNKQMEISFRVSRFPIYCYKKTYRLIKHPVTHIQS
jgi:hypothetical protein